jgi:ABC-type ATPase with predicted acetyltransferase domain
MAIQSAEDPKDLIKLTPPFSCADQLRLGSTNFNVKLTEIVSEEDYQNYQFLEQFHYRSSGLLNVDDDGESTPSADLGGRRAVLLCYLRIGMNWQAVGYIELQMPLMMVKPRHVLFATPFHHPKRPIAWQAWNTDALKKYVNTTVRIARVVTSPEFRGLGLAKTMITAATQFSKDRWHIKGVRPLFIEISAEMLKYVDFVTSSGLHLVGYTEGNLARVSKDILSMQRGQKISSGIMSLQKKYLSRLNAAAKALGRDVATAISKLQEVSSSPELLNSLSAEDWYLLKTVLRSPIPYYLKGLDEYSDAYIVENVKTTSKPVASRTTVRSTMSNLVIEGLRIASVFNVPDTSSVRRIMDCFGLQGQTMATHILGPLDIEASPGNIFFIAGASGCGKSVLLKALDPSFSNPQLTIRRKRPTNYSHTAGWLRDVASEDPLIQYFSERWGMERALTALNQVGLSEAFVYLKPYQLLSRGQRYRAKLADLSLRDEPVWLIDEFCADLDPLTAKIV